MHFLPSYHGTAIVLMNDLTDYENYINEILPKRDKTKEFNHFYLSQSTYFEIANNNQLNTLFKAKTFSVENDSLFGGMQIAILNYANHLQVFDNNSNVVITVEDATQPKDGGDAG